jgi:WD40 repeat protein
MFFFHIYFISDDKISSHSINAHHEQIVKFLSSDVKKKLLASVSTNAIKIFTVTKLELLHSLEYGTSTKPNEVVTFAAFIPKSDKIFTVTSDSMVNILTWNLKNYKQIFLARMLEKWEKSLKDVKSLKIRSIAFSNDGNSSAVNCFGNEIIILSNTTWNIIKVFHIEQEVDVMNVSFLPTRTKETHLCYKTSDLGLVITKIEPFQQRKYVVSKGNSYDFLVSSNGQMLVNTMRSGEVIVYSLKCLINAMNTDISELMVQSGATRRQQCKVDQRLEKLTDKVSDKKIIISQQTKTRQQ